METLHTSLSGLIKEQAAAEHLGLSVRTLQAYRVQGGGPPFYKIGRAVRYRLGDLDKFIEARLRFNNELRFIIEVKNNRRCKKIFYFPICSVCVHLQKRKAILTQRREIRIRKS